MNDSQHGMRRFPDEDPPAGSVVDGGVLCTPIDEPFDYVVVGSGAAGAVAAHTLTMAGFSVAIVEEGPWVKTREFGEGVHEAFQRMFRDAGAQTMEGRSFIPLIQGRCVGGSTVMNSAIAWRTPDDVLADWSERFGLGPAVSSAALAPHFDALEADLHVHAVRDEVLGENSRLFLDEAAKQGFEPHRMRRYESGCKGTGRCLTGCPNGAKQGMSVTYVPWALARGARLFASVRVEKVVLERGRATGVVGRATPAEPGRPPGPRVTLRARRGVVVAASTIQTPNLLRRSGVRSPALGEHFQAHPGVGMGAVFDDPVGMSFGATQGGESIHFRTDGRIKLETIGMPPELAAVRIPGVGADLMRRLASYANLAVWVLTVRSDAEGAVRQGWGGRDKVTFSPSRSDMECVRRGEATLARMMFDAGAREVWPGIHGLPSVLTSADQARLIEEGPIDPRAYSFMASHLFGAARMGPEARSCVVGLDFQAHEANGLYVVDSSVFPTNLGVNPQHTIRAMSRLAASRIAERATKRATA